MASGIPKSDLPVSLYEMQRHSAAQLVLLAAFATLNGLATLACTWIYQQAPMLVATVGLGVLGVSWIGWLSALMNFLGLARRELAPVAVQSGAAAAD